MMVKQINKELRTKGHIFYVLLKPTDPKLQPCTIFKWTKKDIKSFIKIRSFFDRIIQVDTNHVGNKTYISMLPSSEGEN